MAEEGGLIDKAKIPFAAYDIVVYFGVGICSLPFLYRYFIPRPGTKLPDIFSGYQDPLINNTVSLIALGFGVYIAGHGISLLSSMLIEQFVYRAIGTPSQIISSRIAPATNDDFDKGFRSNIKVSLSAFFNKRIPVSDVIRLLFHFPVLPIYFLLYFLKLYGFYESKLSTYIVLRTQKHLEIYYDYSSSIINDKHWFKIVEYACANDHPIAMGKMYNYLQMYGLFRSISFLCICSIWLEVFFYVKSGGIGFVTPYSHGSLHTRLIFLNSLYCISFVGFCKFSRRYTEEAIQAFALSKSFQKIG